MNGWVFAPVCIYVAIVDTADGVDTVATMDAAHTAHSAERSRLTLAWNTGLSLV